ncbi:MAG: acyltransferase family protein [Alloprevotella sp.]
MQTITLEAGRAISLIRVLAMSSIVTCHFLQAHNNRWAWVLNVGVQVFLVLSGYLYGHKHVTNWRSWCKARLLKLYLPFILFALTALACIDLFTETSVTYKNYAAYIFDIQGITGG